MQEASKFALLALRHIVQPTLPGLGHVNSFRASQFAQRNYRQLHGEKTVHNINSNITGQIYRWNKADAMLYQYFNKTLWNEIRLEGKGFVEELREFRTKHDEIERDCLGQQVNLRKIALNANVTSFNRYFCQKMLFREIEYVHYFRRKMENSKRKTPTNGFAGSGNGTRIFSEHAHERNGEKTSLLINETDASSVSSR